MCWNIYIFYTEWCENLFCGVLFLWVSEAREKNPQFKLSSQNLSIEHNFFKLYDIYFSVEFGQTRIFIP